MNVLSLDASTKSTGWAIFNEKKLEHYGCITASSTDLIKRITKMINRLDEILLSNNINTIVLEEVRPEQGKNMKTYKALMYLQAAIMFLVHNRFNHIKVEFVYPSEWRKKCNITTGRGIKRETLKKVDIAFIKDTYDIDVNDDEADAIGIGHAYVNELKNEINWE